MGAYLIDNQTFMHELTQEERVKGATKPSLYKSVANTLRKRKKCSTKCFYFDTCPLMAMSMSSPEKKCAMKAFPERIRRRFEKVFLGGEDGLINEITTAIYTYGLEVEAMPGLKGKKEFIDMLFQLHKAKFGDKKQIVSDREPLQINIQQLNTSGTKEIPDGTVKPVLTAIETKRIEYAEAVMEDLKVEDDPESLFNSEKLDKIMRITEEK
jgi:hypothetical protein